MRGLMTVFSPSPRPSTPAEPHHIDSVGPPTVFTQGQFRYVVVGGVDRYRINSDGTLTQVATLTGPTSAQGIQQCAGYGVTGSIL